MRSTRLDEIASGSGKAGRPYDQFNVLNSMHSSVCKSGLYPSFF